MNDISSFDKAATDVLPLHQPQGTDPWPFQRGARATLEWGTRLSRDGIMSFTWVNLADMALCYICDLMWIDIPTDRCLLRT